MNRKNISVLLTSIPGGNNFSLELESILDGKTEYIGSFSKEELGKLVDGIERSIELKRVD